MHVVLSPSFYRTCLGEAGIDGTDGVPGDNGTDGVPGTDGIPGHKGSPLKCSNQTINVCA